MLDLSFSRLLSSLGWLFPHDASTDEGIMHTKQPNHALHRVWSIVATAHTAVAQLYPLGGARTMHSFTTLLPVAALCVLFQGCYTPHPTRTPEKTVSQSDARVDFSDPLLNQRKIFLFGRIDARAAEQTVQKLFYLDSKGHELIDVYIQSPGDEKQDSLVIEHAFRTIKSPVNTWTFTGCNSGGALLLASGTGKRRIFRGAVIILHGLTWGGNPPREYTQPIQDDYMELWRKRARLPASWFPFPYGVLHIVSAEQALEYGIVDEVIDR